MCCSINIYTKEVLFYQYLHKRDVVLSIFTQKMLVFVCLFVVREREREVGHTSINTTDNGKEIFQC